MTTAADLPGEPPAANGERSRSFAGTWRLLRFLIRRDRIKLPAWVGSFGLLTIYLTNALPVAYPEEDLDSLSGLFADPAGRLLIGPSYGLDNPTYDRLIANGYGLYFLIVAALMSILLVVRHTRAEEQTGRAELVRASVVGAKAPLTAALILAVITNALVAVVITALMVAAGHGGGGSFLLGVSVAAGGLAFAGLAALTVQLTQFSRAAAGLAGAGLGLAFALRAGGDMTRVGGNTLSWLSPLAWPQQTAPFVLDRWWPLGLSFAFAVVTAAVGFVLSTRRDLGASLLSTRTGRPTAAEWLRSPLTLALRLQRGSIVAWGAALIISGFLYGIFTESLLTGWEDLPDTFVEVFGTGEENIVTGYLAYMSVFMAYLAAAFAILAVHGYRSEETTGRGEPVLAAPVSRWGWLGGNLIVTAVAAVALLAAAGAATGAGAAIVTGEVAYVWELTASHLGHAPAVLVLLAIAALFFGVLPRAIGLTWAVLAYGIFFGTFGGLIDPPNWLFDLSPFEHAARMPLEPFALAPVAALTVLAAGVAALGLLGFRRRDIDTT